MDQGAALRTGLVNLHSGGSGTPPGRHYDRSARSSLDWDRATTSQEARPGVGAELCSVSKPPVERREASAFRKTRTRLARRELFGAPFGAPLPSLLEGEESHAPPGQNRRRAGHAADYQKRTRVLPTTRPAELSAQSEFIQILLARRSPAIPAPIAAQNELYCGRRNAARQSAHQLEVRRA
jgi:hypothetical protein